MFQNISDFNDTSDYLPIFNASLIADIVIIFMLYYTNIFGDPKKLKLWYEKYRLSAVIADVFILIIGMILGRFFYYKVFEEYTPFQPTLSQFLDHCVTHCPYWSHVGAVDVANVMGQVALAASVLVHLIGSLADDLHHLSWSSTRKDQCIGEAVPLHATNIRAPEQSVNLHPWGPVPFLH